MESIDTEQGVLERLQAARQAGQPFELLVLGRQQPWPTDLPCICNLRQQAAGVDLLPVGDFAWYDQVLTTSLMLGQVPERHRQGDGPIDLDTLFRIARGRAPTGAEAPAAELSKWFNTNRNNFV